MNKLFLIAPFLCLLGCASSVNTMGNSCVLDNGETVSKFVWYDGDASVSTVPEAKPVCIVGDKCFGDCSDPDHCVFGTCQASQVSADTKKQDAAPIIPNGCMQVDASLYTCPVGLTTHLICNDNIVPSLVPQCQTSSGAGPNMVGMENWCCGT